METTERETAYNLGLEKLKEGDTANAMKWLTFAANENVAEAQYMIGLDEFTRKRCPVDYAKAFKWYSKAANQNYPMPRII